MNIAIQSADLDGTRIDGTRIYILELLNRFGSVAPRDYFLIYHRSRFNPILEPKMYTHYSVRSIPFPFFWTQTRFAFELWKNRPDRLWMPMQAIPFVRPSEMEVVVTIHDLAFRKFPEHFPRDDLRRLTLLTDQAIKKSDRIIAVSESTKRDILQYYPDISKDKVRVVYHGYTQKEIGDKVTQNVQVTDQDHSTRQGGKLLYDKRYRIKNGKDDVILARQPQYQSGQSQILKVSCAPRSLRISSRYLLYVGAIQPRKNLELLIHAFEMLKRDSHFSDLKLVLAGERAWLWESVVATAESSEYAEDIFLPGSVSFSERENLYKHASVFVFPSLYEGFGLPILEAFSQDVPVVCADNSSLPEVGGEGALYFEATSQEDLTEKLRQVLENNDMRNEYIKKGRGQLKKFSWDKCAQETMEVIRG